MTARSIGFIGLGIMGVPMATHLVRAGFDVVVWARSAAPAAKLAAVGARVAADIDGVFAEAETVILMLRDEATVDAVLGRGTDAFAHLVAHRTIVQMGTFTTAFSQELAREVQRAAGRYVEAPVSGSRGPAIEGTLVGMLAGEADAVAHVEPVVAAMCGQVFRCGAIPAALSMKLAVNTFLITMVTGLAETFHFAERAGVDANILRDVLDAGPIGRIAGQGAETDRGRPDGAGGDRRRAQERAARRGCGGRGRLRPPAHHGQPRALRERGRRGQGSARRDRRDRCSRGARRRTRAR
ncbi:NAD(P)-dependent oxidoreductase [uncultured Microbacterium sp.]|uniref:NAD(P)-dependent oxidoreductase n=1 Tax=uncultured Microbacterium sp. TaxID=191216 RepID=UPI0025E0D41F|nr:NAD(P)-dependent oxidoreductase [uncultured Microbacterium sp.]